MKQSFRVSRSLVVLAALVIGALPASAARLPDVAPGDVLAAGALATMGPAGDGARFDGLAIVNPGDRPAMCMAQVVAGDGTALGSPAPLEVPAQSMTYRSELLADAPDGARVTLHCDAPFYGFAVTRDDKGATAVLQPQIARTSITCGAGTVCYDFPGVDLVASSKTPTRAILLDPADGKYSRVTVHLEVEIHGWTQPFNGAHGILYMVRDKNKDMFANIFLQGPASNGNALVLRHGFDQTHPEKAKLRVHFFPKDGQTYAFDYVYDPGAGKLSLSVKGPNGQELIHLISKPNVDAVTMGPGQLIHIGLSNPGIVPNEPTSTGWVYKNLHVELTPAQ